MQRTASVLVLGMGLFAAAGLLRCGGDEGVSAEQCQSWSADASYGRRAAQDAAARECSVDADCQLVDYQLSCFEDCGYPSAVAKAGIPALEAIIDGIDRENCDRFEAAGCPGPIPRPCVPAGTPLSECNGGQCTVQSIE